MGLGILTDELFESELNRFNISKVDKFDKKDVEFVDELIDENPRVPTNEPEIKNIKRGRGNVPEVPAELRAIIAQEAIAGAKSNELAELFNVSPQSVNAYKHDATSEATYNKPDPRLAKANNKFRDTIKELASDRLMKAISAITSEKLADAKLNTASAVARDMSTIIKNVSPELNENLVNNQVIIYKPRMKEIDEYDVID